ncbi:vacuolar sorting protein VPS1 [Colletotrichum musicola]|uniref:Vacuolar sorting protein VPS1 n=1 Tax=Colletotrichum musicola TaxID=2175873 RepID=A0A8H6U561_9PEZI|nr:vacuolar sorting protein VPS1 [Colletotrichum musicola]
MWNIGVMDPESPSMGAIPTQESPDDDGAGSEPDSEPPSPATDICAPKEKTIPENPFDTESSRALLDAIDELQSCGVSQELAIPQVRTSSTLTSDSTASNRTLRVTQIVIVGCQSTGKSSLLQTLTDIPFPVGKGCCTRFATRIVSRRTAPGTANATYKYENDHLGIQDFERIMEQISTKYIKIRRGTGINRKNFASQVLRIELSGPTRSHFSILDVPGVISVPRSVNENEMHGVQRLVEDFMRQPSNIVLCVADAVTDLSNQKILATASELVDKKRLIGVFTKCDRVEDPSETVDIATGDEKHSEKSMHDGWFVVRNRGEKDGDDFDLPEAERELFSQAPWRKIREERRGSGMLRRHLGDLLCGHIRENFPRIQVSIRKLLEDARLSRRGLGDPRPTHVLRQQNLRDVVERYHDAAGRTLTSPGSVPDEALRVRAKVHDATRAFTQTMKESGHAYEFEDADVDIAETFTEALHFCYPQFAPKKDEAGGKRYRGSSNPTPPLTPPRKTKTRGHNNRATAPLAGEIRKQLHVWQTTELPAFVNTEVIRVLFRQPSERWERMAGDLIDGVAADIEVASNRILKEVCYGPDGASFGVLHDELATVLGRFQTEAKGRAVLELREHCRRERDSHPQTTDPRFGQMLQKWRSIRLLRALATIPVLGGQDGMEPVAHAEAVFRNVHHSMEDSMVYDVHDVVKVYYQLSIEAFIRYVTRHIIEHFITHEDGPLKGLCTDWVFRLTEEEVEKLAREDEDTVHKRAHFDGVIEKFERADLIAERARRQAPGL